MSLLLTDEEIEKARIEHLEYIKEQMRLALSGKEVCVLNETEWLLKAQIQKLKDRGNVLVPNCPYNKPDELSTITLPICESHQDYCQSRSECGEYIKSFTPLSEYIKEKE